MSAPIEPMSDETLASIQAVKDSGYMIHSISGEALLREVNRLRAENAELTARLALAEAVCAEATTAGPTLKYRAALDAWRAREVQP